MQYAISCDGESFPHADFTTASIWSCRFATLTNRTLLDLLYMHDYIDFGPFFPAKFLHIFGVTRNNMGLKQQAG